MNEIVDFYGDFTKTEIIAGLQKYLRENKIKRKRNDGFGRDKGNGLERPNIEGVTYSWTKFKSLPKDVIIVYAFLKGCKLPYLKELKDSGWFTRKQDKWEERRKLGWRTFHINGKFIQKPPDFLLTNEKPRN